MFKEARKQMSIALKGDPDLNRAYRDNIAMRLYDLQSWLSPKTYPNLRKLNFRNKEVRDKVAEDLLKLIFD